MNDEVPLGGKSLLASWAGKGLGVNNHFCVFGRVVERGPIGFGHHVLVHFVQKSSVPTLGALLVSVETYLRPLGICDCSTKPLEISVYPLDCSREVTARHIIIPPNHCVKPKEVISNKRGP